VRGVAFNATKSLAITYGAGTLVEGKPEPEEAEVLLWNIQPDPTRVGPIAEDAEDPDLAESMAHIDAPPALSLIKSFRTGAPFIRGADFVPNSTLFVCAGGRDSKMQSQLGGDPKNEIRVYDIVSGKEVAKVGRNPKAHFSPINCLIMHPDGRRMYSAAEDGYIKVHDLPERWFELCSHWDLDAPGVTAATKAAQRAVETIRARAIELEEGKAEDGSGPGEEAMQQAREELGISEMEEAEKAYDEVVQGQVTGALALKAAASMAAAGSGENPAEEEEEAED